MMAKRSTSVGHAAIHRWIVRYSPELLERSNRRKRAITGRWHIGETYIKVRGQWVSLTGPSAATATRSSSWFSGRRNLVAAKRFSRKVMKRHGPPERIVIDGSQTNEEAILTCDTIDP
jgi:putative transposase